MGWLNLPSLFPLYYLPEFVVIAKGSLETGLLRHLDPRSDEMKMVVHTLPIQTDQNNIS
jgi:hypothetical protein